MLSRVSLLLFLLALASFCFRPGFTHQQRALCSNGKNVQDRSCSTQIADGNDESCVVRYFPTNSSQCKEMEFGPFVDNMRLGDVILEPYVYTFRKGSFETNFTVLNITFTNIKWNTMMFRFERDGAIQPSAIKNHCRNIEISRSVVLSAQSVLYYDCWWSNQDEIYVGEKYILDFRAEGDVGVKRGQYYFTVPTISQLSSAASIKEWKPFIYIEISARALTLHVNPAPKALGVKEYEIEVVRRGPDGKDTVIQSKTKPAEGNREVTFEHSLLHPTGSYYFWVTPVHRDRLMDPDNVFQRVQSPFIDLNNEQPATVICIASVMSVVVATLFAYYVVLRVLRRYWCKDYRLAPEEEAIGSPPRVLVVYSPTNKLHVECVKSLVNYLRYECDFRVMHDGDISSTVHGDPSVWCQEALNIANYIVYVVGPAEEPSRDDKAAITANCNVDKLLLNLLTGCRIGKQIHVLNVLFEYSKGPVPLETLNDRKFYLLKDWNKFISFLSRKMPAQHQLKRTEKGRCLLEDLTRARTYFEQRCQFGEV